MAAIMMNGQLYGSSGIPVTDAASITYDNTTTALASTTVQGAIDAAYTGLNTSKQNATDNSLTTTDKTVVGAINEHESDITGLASTLALKQNSTDNSLETTDKTVVGAINEHEGDITSLKSGLTNYEKQNNLNLEVPDRKNVLPNGVKSGSFAGVEWTLNNDGSITFNGTATQQIYNKMYFSTDLDLPVGEYIYNGGSEYITFQLANKAESQSYYTYTAGSGYIEVTQAMVGDMIARLIINNGTVLNNVTIYPMIRPKSIESGVYAPYIPSVESRIEAVENGLVKITKESFEQITVNAGSKKFVTNVGLLTDNVVVTAYSDNSDVIAYVATATTTYQVYLYNPTNAAVTSNITVMVAKV